jgi:hypothetical protein
MQDKEGGEASVSVPGACLSPSHLRSLSEKHLKRRGLFPWSKARRVSEELLFVPYFYFRFVNPKYRNRFYLYEVLVDGTLGFCEFIRGSLELKQLPVSGDLLLEKAISKEEAEAKARKAVESFVLRRQSLWVKEIKVELIEAGEVYYPYWVCYLETPKGIELLALNGITGAFADSRAENVLGAGIARAEWQRARS